MKHNSRVDSKSQSTQLENKTKNTRSDDGLNCLLLLLLKPYWAHCHHSCGLHADMVGHQC